MSDNEEGGKKGGYRLEYASSARAKCKGRVATRVACGFQRKYDLIFDTELDYFLAMEASRRVMDWTLSCPVSERLKGLLRAWRHWGCATAKVLANIKKSIEEADDLDGFEELRDEDKDKIRKAWEEGHVADEDIPESARKNDGEEEDEEEEEKPKKKAGAKAAAKKDKSDEPGVFKLEYASSGRAKCKESIGKDYFRIGQEVDFRGNKSFQYLHWGCLSKEVVAKLKKSYSEPSGVDGYSDLKEAEQEKVNRAWEADEIPDDDKGPGEPNADASKKKTPAKKAKKDDGEPPKKKARKAKKPKDEEEEEEEAEDEDEEEEKPKKRAPAKKAAAAKKAPAKKRAAKKNDSESGEDFGDEIAAVEDDDVEEEDEDADAGKKRKASLLCERAPASKAKASSKPPSKAAKPNSSRRRQPVAKESEDDD
ncbi:hypothetical protein EIP86_007317 [Pleurotus ostreatoroseus]|nr:hypothetical protein EIP86_007317 [Pleurotus ostreatoroseus]